MCVERSLETPESPGDLSLRAQPTHAYMGLSLISTRQSLEQGPCTPRPQAAWCDAHLGQMSEKALSWSPQDTGWNLELEEIPPESENTIK